MGEELLSTSFGLTSDQIRAVSVWGLQAGPTENNTLDWMSSNTSQNVH